MHVSRRNFLAALACFLAALPFSAHAQQSARVARVGFLAVHGAAENPEWSAAFIEGMRALGHTEGGDYHIEFRHADNDLKRLDALAAELVALKPDVIFAPSTPAALAVHKLSGTIPIVIAGAADPVATGLARSLDHPMGNVTGVTGSAPDLLMKRVELLRQMRPSLQRVALIYNPDSPADALPAKEFQEKSKLLRIEAMYGYVRGSANVESAFRELGRNKAQAVIADPVVADAALRAGLIEQPARHGMLAIYGGSEYVREGGLISYGPDTAAVYRRAASYVDQILKGVRPSALSIEQPRKFELFINLKALHALRLKLPQAIVSRADKVIE